MHTRSARLCRYAVYGVLNLVGRSHHKVGKLVYNYNYVRHFLNLGIAQVFNKLVIARKVAHAAVGKHFIAPLHFGNRPPERPRRLARVGYNGNKQVRYAVVNSELNHLRVYHQKLYFVGRRLVKQAYNY